MRTTRLVIASVAVLFMASACSTGNFLSQETLQSGIAEKLGELGGVSPDLYTVECPGQLEGIVGTTMECTVSGDAGSSKITVTVTSVDDTTIYYDFADSVQ